MATALLLSSPDLPIGAAFNTRPPLVLRHAPPFKSSYHWNLRATSIIEGIATGCTQDVSFSVAMLQGQDGLHWFVEGSIPQLDICRTVITAIRKWGLIFEAHPQLHQFPWSVPDVTPNLSVIKALGAQALRHCKKIRRSSAEICCLA
uniref:RxLR effector candidate protein n=1 Tax=Hyaloperonospora arabidopsidis (strain Emoy2) TaxID=559515 RepID=M4BXD9_HYAAE